MAEIIDLKLSVKRICLNQTSQVNPGINLNKSKRSEIVVEDYYRINIFAPYIDFFINQLEERFMAHTNIFKGFDLTYYKNIT